MTPCNPPYRQGTIALVQFPFTDAATSKKRPALIVSNANFHAAYGLCIFVAITSSYDPNNLTPQQIEIKGAELTAAGLAKPSVIRTDLLFTLDQNRIAHSLGTLSPKLLNKVLSQLHANF